MRPARAREQGAPGKAGALRSAPGQEASLVVAPLHDATQADRFRTELEAFLDAARAARAFRHGEAVELDDATLEKLRSLGYTQ